MRRISVEKGFFGGVYGAYTLNKEKYRREMIKMKFLDKRTNVVKNAYSIVREEKRVIVKFTENGKAYPYKPENIEIMDEPSMAGQPRAAHRIYRLEQPCYKCGRSTGIYTYIVFSDNADEDVVFPWDKRRLLENQNIFAHLQDPSIEYYGLKTIGDDANLDRMLLEKFPERIKMQYSKTQGRSYPMNLCEHCGAKQGEYFIYRCINELIDDMKEIELFEEN